jgi:hypothetical protein
MQKEYCFRCTNELITTNVFDDITFYECQQCERNYAKATGRSLTDRWGSPISIPLYSIIFTTEIVEEEEVKELALTFQENYSKKRIAIIIDDIDEEIKHPKQKIVDMLDLKGTEEIARDFLKRLSAEMKKLL